MFCYAVKVVSLASSNLKSQREDLVSSIYPRINVLGLVGIPAALLLLLVATALWILVFFALPILLLFAWMALTPWKLWLFLRSRMTGNRFLR